MADPQIKDKIILRIKCGNRHETIEHAEWPATWRVGMMKTLYQFGGDMLIERGLSGQQVAHLIARNPLRSVSLQNPDDQSLRQPAPVRMPSTSPEPWILARSEADARIDARRAAEPSRATYSATNSGLHIEGLWRISIIEDSAKIERR